MKFKIFISSVQSEFASERKALADYIRNDAMLGDFFEVFLFEEQPARNRSAQAVYLDEVASCDVYLGLFGSKYGSRDSDGVSPTEREYDHATELHKTRLAFVKNVPRNSLIARAMSWTSYVEKSGSGTGEILDKCVAYGLARPEFEPTAGFFKTVIWRASSGVRTSAPSQGLVGTQSAPSRHPVAAPSRGTQSRHPVCDEGEKAIHERVIALCDVPRSTKELLEKVGRRDRTKFKRFVLRALMEDGILEWTIPDKPNSRLQKYRLTSKGRTLAAKLAKMNCQRPEPK